MSRLWVRVVNDILHDLSAGAWPGAVAAAWLVRSGARGALSAAAFADLQQAWSAVFLIMAVALAVLVVTGIVRLRYRSLGIPPDLLAARTRAALIKHAVFVTVFLLAIVAAATIV